MTARAEPLLTVAEVAARLRIAPKTLLNWRHLGKGPTAFRVGREVRYEPRDIEAWLRAQKATTGDLSKVRENRTA